MSLVRKSFFDLETFKALPKKEIVKGVAIIGAALAAIIGGGVLIGLGAHALAPIQYMHPTWGRLVTLLPGSAQSHLIGMSFLVVGGAAAIAGILLLGHYIANKAKEKSPRLCNLDKTLEESAMCRTLKLATVVAACVVGAILIGISAYCIAHAGPNLVDGGRFIGAFISNTGAQLSIAGLTGGSALVALATMVIAHQFLRKRETTNVVISVVDPKRHNLASDQL